MSWQNASTRKSWRMRRAYPGIRDHREITQTEDHSKDENYHGECRDSQTSNRWTEDQEQNLHSSTRLADRPQAARHAWEYDEDFTTRWPAKQDSKSGKTDENQKKRKHQDNHQNQHRSQQQCRRAKVNAPTETVGGDLVRRRLLCKTRPEHEWPELDDESEPVDKYQQVEIVDCNAPGMGDDRTKLTLRPPEEHDIEDDAKEIEVDDLDMTEVLSSLSRNQ